MGLVGKSCSTATNTKYTTNSFVQEKNTNISRGNIYRLRDLSNAAIQFDKWLNMVKSNNSTAFRFFLSTLYITHYIEAIRLFFFFVFSCLFLIKNCHLFQCASRHFCMNVHTQKTASQTKRNCKLQKEVSFICDRVLFVTHICAHSMTMRMHARQLSRQ